jgi:hypothetical protein
LKCRHAITFGSSNSITVLTILYGAPSFMSMPNLAPAESRCGSAAMILLSETR